MTSFRSELGPGGECIQLVHCIAPTEQQRNDPKYLPQLLVNKDAQRRIETNFRAPISVLVLVGNMGVGKSKLASVIVNSFYKQHPEQSLRLFRSGAGVSGVTQGVWMWSEPLEHPDGQGSILLLDCEGMGDLDENVGANLYLFCMLISTSFALLIRPARIERSQCERLYHALLRFEHMKTPHVLPNLWIVALEMPEFIQNQEDGDDVVITKEEWMKQIFDVDGNKHKKMAAVDVNTLKQRYDYINRMLIKKDAINISFIPDSLKRDRQDLDIWKLWNDSGAQEYQQSVLRARKQLLSTGGKVLPGAVHGQYIRPEEFAKLIMELVDLINNNHMPNPDSLLERYLRTRFVEEVVAEQIKLFKNELYLHVLDVICPVIHNLKRLETEQERMQHNNELNCERERLTKLYINRMIQLGKSKIFFCTADVPMQTASNDAIQLPKSIQDELYATERCMHEFIDPEKLLEERRHVFKLAEARRLEEEAELMQKIAEAEEKRQVELANRERERVEEAAVLNRQRAVELQRQQEQLQRERDAQSRAYAAAMEAENDRRQKELRAAKARAQAEEMRRRVERERAERQAREQAERQARERAERQAREQAERQAREQAERQAREQAERQAREQAEQASKSISRITEKVCFQGFSVRANSKITMSREETRIVHHIYVGLLVR